MALGVPSPLSRLGAAAQNALEVARFGGLETGEASAPYAVVAAHPIHTLRRYFADDVATDGAPVLLVPPMMLSAEVWDVSPQASAVRDLHALGVDPWVVDFGAPEHIEGALERTLADHVLAVSEAVDEVREATGRDVHLAGYSQGGMFCYQTAAYRRGRGLASLVTFGSPVDTRGMVPFGLPEELIARGAATVLEAFGRRTALPAWASRTGFRLLDPVKATRQQLDFLRQLHDREALLPREAQRRFLQVDGFVAWPGPALADFMRQFVAHNRMLIGGFAIEDRLVTLADIDCPVLTFVGEHDELAPPASVRPIVWAAPRAEVYERFVGSGHFGLVVGSAARENTWPVVADWTRWIVERGELPDDVHPAPGPDAPDHRPGVAPRLGHGVGLAAGVGVGVGRSVVGTATRTAQTARDLAAEAAGQLPRLAQLEGVSPRTRTSLALLLDQSADRTPEAIAFLFEDRAHTHAALKHRVDSVVRGLISVGVRQGEHVGVLMHTRPSALVCVAALSRLGAVAVLLRPDNAIAFEAELGQVSRIVCDPDHLDGARSTGAQVLVLGGGAEDRDLGPGVVDMERIDPDAVALPRWFSPNPGRARDLAFILFTGEGERTRVTLITNRRWLLSAVGTASSAALGVGDTVYSVTPIYHPSGLLVGIGGAIAGGARIALTDAFDPGTFWDEVRRYGVTVASYTWTMLRALVDAPPHPGERHHPVRLFVGSGMPPALWQRVLDRFGPVGVVEFWTAPAGEAVLVNLGGRRKVGAMGRRLPGSARVRIARYDREAGRLMTGRDGFVARAERGEVGLMLVQADPDDLVAGAGSALRGVFRRDDAWLATGDLFRRDEDGDAWLVDPIAALVRTAQGAVAPSAVRDALGALEAVDLAVAYGLPTAGPHELLAAAVCLRHGATLSAREVATAVRGLEPARRPAVVRVVDAIPVSSWYRPLTSPLRADGIPQPGAAEDCWWLGIDGATYRPLTPTARRRLLAG